MKTITLTERQPQRLPAAALSAAAAEQLRTLYAPQVALAFPSPATDGRWELTSRDWVGTIPLAGVTLQLRPKIPLAALLQMLAVTYDLPLRFLPALTPTTATEALFDRLAALLASRVRHRARRGLHQTYLETGGRLPYVRGRIDLARTLSTPQAGTLACRYEERTVDQPDNQILAWTLYRLGRLALLRPETARLVGRARRLLGSVTLHPWSAEDVAARLADRRAYTHLNADYRPLHALCRLFLAGCGPDGPGSDALTVPFLVDTARLFESFVAGWLTRHLAGQERLRVQERLQLGDNGLHFRVDMVLYGDAGHRPVAVLDTKYKAGPPTSADVAQVAAYAHAAGCRRGVLVYPAPLAAPLAARVGDVTVSGACFDLGRSDLDAAGAQLLALLRKT